MFLSESESAETFVLHSSLNRMLEQMCGYISPTEDGWQQRIDEMKSSIKVIANSRANANRIEGFDIPAELSDFDKRMIDLMQ